MISTFLAVKSFLVLSLLTLLSLRSFAFNQRSSLFRRSFSNLKMISIGQSIPEGIQVDIIMPSAEGTACSMNEAQDLGSMLKSSKKAVLFAVPGAFTPTCSAQHLPGFVTQAVALKAKGVEDIYCLSVNDRFVMRSWAEATPGVVSSGIKMVADGNGELTTALGLNRDATGSRMGIRSKRYAAVIENGKVTILNVDEKGLVNSSAEVVLAYL